MTRFVALCEECDETKTLGESGKCKSCFNKWLEKALNAPEYLTDNLQSPQPDTAKIDAAVERARALNPIHVDDLHNPQPNHLAKIDKTIAQMKKAMQEQWYKSILDTRNNIVDENGLTEKAAERQRQINEMWRKVLASKNLPPTSS